MLAVLWWLLLSCESFFGSNTMAKGVMGKRAEPGYYRGAGRTGFPGAGVPDAAGAATGMGIKPRAMINKFFVSPQRPAGNQQAAASSANQAHVPAASSGYPSLAPTPAMPSTYQHFK